MRVAYLLTSFPNTSEIFILNEIVEAIRQGVDIKVYSQLVPKTECPHASVKEIRDKIEYLPSTENVNITKAFLLHLLLFSKKPLHYLKTLIYVLKHRQHAALWAFKVCVCFAWPILQFKPDVIHTHFAYGNARFAMLIAKMLGIPYTFTIHGWYDIYKAPPPYLREVILESKKTLTVCDYNKKFLIEEYQIVDQKMEVVRCGIPIEKFAANGVEKVERLIISVGRLHYHKAQHVLIEACKMLSDKGVAFSCWIIGEGELHDELQRQINVLGLKGKVSLLGEKSTEEVQKIVPKAQVFALTSEVEVVGLASAEAMAAGLPVVATAIFGVPELIGHNETGFLSPPNDPASVAIYLKKLLEDKEKCIEMGIKGRQKVSELHDLPVQVKRLISTWL